MTRKQIYLLIACLIFLAFANSLTGKFVGDDFLLFVGNDFYKNPYNLTKLVSRDFVTTTFELQKAGSPAVRSYSGCVAYRPVTALFFFLDSALWKMNPTGYRLTNLFLHIGVSCAVFLLIFLILQSRTTAVFAALLFAVHPVHTELVNNAGYRSDLVATLFFVLSMISFIRWFSPAGKRVHWVWGGISFFLALFAKETAVTLPFLLLLYYQFFLKRDKPFPRPFFLSIFGILFFYLLIYLFVFPNSTFTAFASFDFVQQVTSAFVVFSHYLKMIFLPFTVSVLPLFYAPGFDSISLLNGIAILIFLGCVIFCYTQFSKGEKLPAFFLFWFLLTYLPTADLMPIPNPFALRFLYLPAIGLSVLAAFLIRRGIALFKSSFIQFLIKVVIVGSLIVTTLPINTYYRTNVSFHDKMKDAYPQAAYPYLVLGNIARQNKDYLRALAFFDAYLKRYPENEAYTLLPQRHAIHVSRGSCFVDDPDLAIQAFEQALALKPDHAPALANIGKAYLMKKNYTQSLEYIYKSLKLNEELYEGYIYGIQTYRAMDQTDKAEELLDKALTIYPRDAQLIKTKKVWFSNSNL